MNKQKYLPQWTDRYPKYDQQYLAANIMCKENGNESLLSVRFKDDLSMFYKTNFKSSCYAGELYGKDCCSVIHQICIEDARYTFAKALYKKSCDILFEKYRDIGNIKIEKQRSDGVYPIIWRYEPVFIKEKLFEIMSDLIKEGFFVQEHIETRVENERIISFNGVMGYDDRIKLLRNRKSDIPTEVQLKKARYTLDDCLQYYVIISDDILELGNQQRVYKMLYEENKCLFDAAENKDTEKLFALAKAGYNLNAINDCGDTPFKIYVNNVLLEDYDYYGVLPPHIKETIDKLIKLGANPAIVGVTNNFDSLLHASCVRSNAGLVKYLLEMGVNPVLYMFLDDYCCEKDKTLLDWEEAHITPDDNSEEEAKRVLYTKEIVRLLKEYSNKNGAIQ